MDDFGLPARLQYRFCPMCGTILSLESDADGIPRSACRGCGWVHFPANTIGVTVVVETVDGVVFLFPPGEPEDAPAALVGGVVEFGESSEEAAVREAREESGLDVEVVEHLGWWFDPEFGEPYGPMLTFMVVVKAVGGELRESPEGDVRVCGPGDYPAISPNRRGSQRMWAAYSAGGR